jgi:Ca-activated chloride channel family protein
MEFGAQYFVVLLLLVPGLAVLYVWGFRRRRQSLARFVEFGAAQRLIGAVDWRRRGVKAAFLVAAIGFLVIAEMQPRWGLELSDTARRGRDIFILLDVSRSMLAEDAAPSRIEAAKAAIVELVQELRQVGGNRLGLVIFAGRAKLQSPLTLDYGFFLNRLAEASPAAIDRQGSNVAGAIQKTLFGFGEIDPTYTDLIVITDGEDHDSLPVAAARIAADEGVGLYTVGVGDPAEGARIPIVVGEDQRQYLRFDGADVITVMRESQLREMARVAKGAYVQARTGPIELGTLFEEKISNKAQRELEAGEDERKADRYAWFVVLALLLLVTEMLLPERPPRAKEA